MSSSVSSSDSAKAEKSESAMRRDAAVGDVTTLTLKACVFVNIPNDRMNDKSNDAERVVGDVAVVMFVAAVCVVHFIVGEKGGGRRLDPGVMSCIDWPGSCVVVVVVLVVVDVVVVAAGQICRRRKRIRQRSLPREESKAGG